jgi:hypothetical protein
MDKLEDFLTELAIEPQKLGQFIHDPEATMTAASLSSEDKAALRFGFPDVIYARLAGVPIQEAFQKYFLTMSPPPPPEPEPEPKPEPEPPN